MAQELLENTNTYLLNMTADTSSYAKNAVKNYQESYTKNGQTFGDVLSNANDRFANNNNNKYLNNPNKNNNNISDRNTRDFNNKNNNIADRNSANNRNNNNVSNNSQTVDRKSQLRDAQENSRTMREKSQSSDDNTATNSNETNSTEEMSSVDTENLNSVELVSEDDVINSMTQEDIDALNQLLVDDMATEDTTAETDLYINAYYQSTLDALNTTVDESATTEDLTNLNTLANAETEEVAQTVALNTLDEMNNVDVNADTTTETEVKVDNTLNNLDTKANVKDATSNEKGLKAGSLEKENADGKVATKDDLKQQQLLDDNKKVEVDTLTNETSNVDNDVLVNATDEVAEQVKPVNTNNQDDSKTSFREVMEKAGLDDAKLEALNMTITNTETGSDLSNGFQGSAQEDIAKLAVNGVNGKKDASEIANNKEFSKLVDTKNMQQEEAKEISKNDILAQINNKMQAKNINGQQKITLQLTPESLGKITIELSKGKDGLQAKMLTDNAQVRDMLEKNIDGLKSTLANQGVTVNNVSVKVASSSETASEFDFGRESFNQEQAQQDFAGSGERGGEQGSQYENESSPRNAMNDLEMPTEGMELETEMAMDEGVELESEPERVAVGAGNVDIEV